MLNVSNQDTLLRRPKVEILTGLGRSSIYFLIQKGDFPAPVRLGLRSVAWRESEVLQWIASRQPTTRHH